MQKYLKGLSVLVVALLAFVLVVPAMSQTQMTIEASDQLTMDGTVMVSRVVTPGAGFVVIHADGTNNSLGEAIGFAPVGGGENSDLQIPIDMSKATPVLHAVVHTDDHEIGKYEFGTVKGADEPAMVNGKTVESALHISTLFATDQIVKNQVTVARVIVQQPSWVVIHAGDANGFSEAIGETFVDSGATSNVTVDIDETKRTDILWPMIHTDTGAAGKFEFGTVDQTDLPLALNDKAAMLPIVTVPSIRVGSEQLVLGKNGFVSGNTAPVVIESVLSDGPGFLAIYSDANSATGDLIGFTPVQTGLNTNVKVDVDPGLVTSNLWTTLHVDDHTTGTFEFGTTEGADMPAVVNDQPVSFSVPVAPFLAFQQKQALDNDQIRISQVLVNDPGFVVVQADDGSGHPGAVVGQVPVNPGLNQDIAAALDPNQLTNPLYLTLHIDTNQIGVFETADGTDSAVLINNQPVLGQLTLTGNLPVSSAALTFPCTLALAGATDVNLRSGPGMNFDVATVLTGDQTLTITDEASDADGFTWWQTSDGSWVRSDIFGPDDKCQPAQ
jgi:hypothetical protein